MGLGDVEEKDLTDSVLVSSDFPCPRCTLLILDSGVREVYFGRFKKNRYDSEFKPGIREERSIKLMRERGISVRHIFEVMDLKYDRELRDHVPTKDFMIADLTGFSFGLDDGFHIIPEPYEFKNDAEYYKALMLDEGFRDVVSEWIERMKSEPVPRGILSGETENHPPVTETQLDLPFEHKCSNNL